MFIQNRADIFVAFSPNCVRCREISIIKDMMPRFIVSGPKLDRILSVLRHRGIIVNLINVGYLTEFKTEESVKFVGFDKIPVDFRKMYMDTFHFRKKGIRSRCGTPFAVFHYKGAPIEGTVGNISDVVNLMIFEELVKRTSKFSTIKKRVYLPGGGLFGVEKK